MAVFILFVFLFPAKIFAVKPPPSDTVFDQTDFWFRNDDGSEVTATGWGYPSAAKNSPITFEGPAHYKKNAKFRLRVGLGARQGDSGSITPRLEFRSSGKEGNCGLGENEPQDTWKSMTTGGGKRFVLRDSLNFNNQASTTKQITTGADSNFVSGLILDTQNPAPAIILFKNEKTEYEWSLEDAHGFEVGLAYSFRVTDDGTALNKYLVCPVVVFATPYGTGTAPTVVNFSGQAFPGAKILIIDKDVKEETPLRQNIITSEDGKFRIDFIGILQSTHSFGIVIKDQENRASQSKFFNIDTFTNSITAKDILVPPTLDFVNTSVTRGNNSIIIGSASPEHSVQIEIDGKIQKEVKSSKDGYYKFTLPTSDLDFGPHKVKVKQTNALEKRESDFSIVRTFTVSKLSQVKADFSGDGKIDIKDWSMFLSHWNSKDSDRKKVVDLNQDGKVNLSDFSIFIRNIRKR